MTVIVHLTNGSQVWLFTVKENLYRDGMLACIHECEEGEAPDVDRFPLVNVLRIEIRR